MPNTRPTEKQTKIYRRSFLDFFIGTMLATLAGGILYPIFRFLSPVKTAPGAMEEEKFSMPLTDVPEGEAKIVRYKDSPVVVIHIKGREVVALSAVCTHLGCVVKWHAEAGKLICPCHGATYNKFGQVLGGPAPKPLPSMDVRVEDGKIWIV